MTRLYIGNLPFSVAENDIKALFLPIDGSARVTLLLDRQTGRGRGFGFAEVDPDRCADVLATLDGATLNGRRIRVEPARTPGVKDTRNAGRAPQDTRIRHRRQTSPTPAMNTRPKTSHTLSIPDAQRRS